MNMGPDYLREHILRLINPIVKNLDRQVLQGWIDKGYTSGKPRVLFPGETTPGAKQYSHLSTYQPMSGDHVLLVRIGRQYVIVGKVGDFEPIGGGATGALQFTWDGTRLGVKTADQETYSYSELKGAPGDSITGPPGPPGPKGEPFKYTDFTTSQLEALRGPTGAKGEAFKYTDFTSAQLELLRGPQGIPGAKGDPFRYADFTPAQLELLRGPTGAKGEPFRYTDFTAAQLEALKGAAGAKGDPFTYADFTPTQLEALRGPQGIPGTKGDPFKYTDFTAAQLEALRGPQGIPGVKGDPFRYSDFTTDQLAALKGATGAKGDPFRYTDFTAAQLEALRGPTGAKGDPFRYTDFTAAQLEALRGPQGIPGVKGDPFRYTDFTAAQLEALRGPQGVKGDPGQSITGPQGAPGEAGASMEFSWNGTSLGLKTTKETAFKYTNLQGPKGDPFKYTDFTAAQLEALRGPAGAKGDPFKYTDFTAAQLEALRGPQGIPGVKGDPGASITGPQGDPGAAGADMQFLWSGTSLGIKTSKDSTYTYTDLRGPKGDPGASIVGPQGDPGPRGEPGPQTVIGDSIITTTNRSWLAPTFAGAWKNLGQGYEPGGYYLDALGFVRLKGFLTGGTTGNVFILPSGFRPSSRRVFIVFCSGTGTGRLDITTLGEVILVSGTGFLSLEGVTFNR